MGLLHGFWDVAGLLALCEFVLAFVVTCVIDLSLADSAL